ncbi:MAG: urease accessory protein UreF [Cyanobacteria bacterium P01_A01_bin.70]
MRSTARDSSHLLTLLQLASPALPVGAYSYSEGIETLAAQGIVADGATLCHWLVQELQGGGIRLETALMGWCYTAAQQPHADDVIDRWNQWLSAFRETEEMRSQSWQMGRSLLRLFNDIEPALARQLPPTATREHCNFAIAYGLVAQAWEIPLADASLAYLHSWAANLVSAAVRSVPLGQTEGQRLLRQLVTPIQQTQVAIATLTETDLMACSWGVTLASMQHETEYSRLFRS